MLDSQADAAMASALQQYQPAAYAVAIAKDQAAAAPAAGTPAAPAATTPAATTPTLPDGTPAKVGSLVRPATTLEDLQGPVTDLTGEMSDTMGEALAPPKSAAGYTLPNIAPGEKLTPELTAMREGAQAMLFEAALPGSIGNEVARRVGAGLTNPPSDMALSHAKAAAITMLKQAWKGDYETNLAAVKTEMTRIFQKHPNARDYLDRSGVGNDPWLVQQIFNGLRARGTK